MKRYEFTITITGDGNNADEAWNDAVEAMSLDPGCTPEPEEYTVTEVEDEDEEE